MLSKKGIVNILVVALFLGISLSLISNLKTFKMMFLISLGLILVNVIFKEMAANYYDLRIEHKIWEISRYGFRPKDYFKSPFPIGVIMPILSFFLSAGYFIWLNVLVFDSSSEVFRAVKRRGSRAYSEYPESHEGLVAFFGLFGNLIVGGVSILLGYTLFAQLSFLYAFCSSIPIGNLDGNKILFGEQLLSKISIVVSFCLWVCSVVFL